MNIHETYMRKAIREAHIAFGKDEVPIGAVIVFKGQIIARAHNQIKTLRDPTAHAEMIVLTQAAAYLKNERLKGCSMYATIEPCAMCAGAMVLSRIDELYYATKDPKSGADGSVLDILHNKKLNHRIRSHSGILKEEASFLIREFFRRKRRRSTQVAEGAGLLSL